MHIHRKEANGGEREGKSSVCSKEVGIEHARLHSRKLCVFHGGGSRVSPAWGKGGMVP